MRRHLTMTSLLWAALVPALFGQSIDPNVLVLDLINNVEYVDDTGDPQQWGKQPGVTPVNAPSGFPYITNVADIVAANGQTVKGTMVGTIMAFGGSPTVRSGFTISDITRASQRNLMFEILKSDGSAIGSIAITGLVGAAVPPGAPSSQANSNFIIVGGTGAFAGARGVAGFGTSPTPLAGRVASMSEDPANRRLNGGGNRRVIFQMTLPLSPAVLPTQSGPAITHSSDFSLVTAAKPAAPGETLSLFVSGLGPTNPSRDANTTFKSSPLANVTSPIEVTIGGKQCTVLAAVGYPGSSDAYQLNIRVPADAASGEQDLRLSVAWVAAPAVKVSIR